MVENYKDLESRITTCLRDRKQRTIYFEEDADNFLIIGRKDIKQLCEIMIIEVCGNFDYSFDPIKIEQYKEVEKMIFGDNKVSSTKEEVLDREILVILSILNEQLKNKK